MENYKVRVSNKVESKEVQELFFELGYGFEGGVNKKVIEFEYLLPFYFFSYNDRDLTVSGDQALFYRKIHKELTIQQLRDLVTAKTKKIPYLVKTIDKWEEQQLTSDTPESATCLKIPDFANAAHTLKDSVFFTILPDVGANTIWRRQPKTMLTPTHPEELPFIDDEPKHDDNVNHPSHYTQGSIECIEALEAATVNKQGIEAVCVANIIKYLWRYESKNGLEDVKKAQWYLQKLADKLEQNNG